MSTPPNPNPEGQGGTGNPPAPPAGGGQPPNPDNKGEGGQGGGSGTPPQQQFKGEFDPEKAARLIDNLRSDLDAERTKRTEMETNFSAFMEKFGQLFGKGDEKQLTPEQIQQKAEQSAQEAREASVKLAVYQVAAKHEADPDALLDSASFVRAVAKLDPTADTFAANVETAIKKAVESNARLKASTTPPVPPKGGFDMNNGDSGKRQLTAAEVDHLSKTNPEALVQARKDGLLKDYLAS
jgi:hypothetical protein